MSNDPHFAPVLSQHAIERCAASIVLTPVLPEKSFVRLIEVASEELTSRGFTKQSVHSFGIEFRTDGQVRPMIPSANMPHVFVSPNQSEQVTIGPDGFNWASTSYVRWQPFIGGL